MEEVNKEELSGISVWILAMRPKTLWAAVSPVIVGLALAKADGYFYLPTALATLFGAVMIQIGTNFANDYYDFVTGADGCERKGPLRVTQSGLIKAWAVRYAFIASFALAALAGIYLIKYAGMPILIIGVLSIAAGILYTGGPLPFGYIGLGDIFVLIFFGFVAVGGTYFVQTDMINPVVLIAGAAPGLIAMAILAVNNLRDRTTDIIAGKKTLAVLFGSTFVRWEYAGALIIAIVIPVILCVMTRGHYISLISMLIILLIIAPVKVVFGTEDGPPLNKVLAQTGQVLLIHSVLFSIGWLI